MIRFGGGSKEKKPAKSYLGFDTADVVMPDLPESVEGHVEHANTAQPENAVKPGEMPAAKAGNIQTSKPGEMPAAKPGVMPAAKPGNMQTARPGEMSAAKSGVMPTAKPGDAPVQKTVHTGDSAAAAHTPNKVKFGLEPILPYSIEEAINRLRINISFLGTDVKKIMIVSSEPNEGKSFIALNLWKQMAEAGERSILIDLDMRKSTMKKKYQLEREDGKELKGTSHFLSGDDPIEDVILHTKFEYGDLLPNVDNIVNPSMLLESRKFSAMMKYMEERYRYVFVDVPPLGLVSDGELIANACDGAVLTVRGGVTSRNVIRNSIRQLERAGCPVLGIVLNRVGGAGSTYYHKYYGKYYGKHYGSKYYYNDQYYYSGK